MGGPEKLGRCFAAAYTGGSSKGDGAAASCGLAASLPNTTCAPLLLRTWHQIDRHRRSEHGERLRWTAPQGRPEGSPIEHYVVEDHADHALGTFKTQYEAIDWAKGRGHIPHVARVGHLNDKKKADHWRAV
jgi:hypothetical protein